MIILKSMRRTVDFKAIYFKNISWTFCTMLMLHASERFLLALSVVSRFPDAVREFSIIFTKFPHFHYKHASSTLINFVSRTIFFKIMKTLTGAHEINALLYPCH